MDSNLSVAFVLACFWLIMDRKISLCLVIIGYYILYMITELTNLQGYFGADTDTTLGTYCVQLSVDAITLVAISVLSMFDQKRIVLYLSYGAIVATSFLLNGVMLYDQALDLSTVYQLHMIRQELSLPLDVMFAVLGSARDAGQNTLDYLHTAYRAVYNRLNRFNQIMGRKQ